MNTKPLLIVSAGVLAAGVLGAIGYALYVKGMDRGMVHAAASTSAGTDTAKRLPVPAVPDGLADGEEATRRHVASGLKAGDTDPTTGRTILYYQDPMVPGRRFEQPGKSPFMDMMLVPVYANADGDSSHVVVSPRVQQSLGVRTAAVVEGDISPEVAAVGSITWNERDQVVLQTRATAFVERVHVRATLDPVVRGQPLAELYVPDWIAAQEEFLSVRRMAGADIGPLIDGARQRMRQAGMSDTQIAQLERGGRIQQRFTLMAPISGVVTDLAAREGMTVAAGTTLFRINGTATVWANAEVPESQAAPLRPGARVEAQSPAAPGARFTGKVQSLLPGVDPTTRTLKARLELVNAGGRLVPGMFVQMRFVDLRTVKALLVPTEAVIQTGRRTVVMLALDGNRFRPVEVEIGTESGGQTAITRGLQAGQRVVVSSQFLIDSEASLKGFETRLGDESRPPSSAIAPRYSGTATIDAIGTDAMTLSHGPVPALNWGPMTMDFKLPEGGVPPGIKVGDRVDFAFHMNADGMPQLTHITAPTPEARTPSSAAPGASR